MRQLAIAMVICVAVGTSACARDPKLSLESGGRERVYYVHTPKGYTSSQRWPLILVLHGRTGTGPGMERIARFDEFADRSGIIAVYPNGIGRSWADGRGATPAEQQGVDDVAFLSTLLDKLEGTYSIDPSRVYATGLSNGGFMSFRLGCELSARIAAIAPVGATLSAPLAGRCHPSRAISVLEINGTDDPLVPYHGGALRRPLLGETSRGAGGTILSAHDSVQTWARLDGCSANPTLDTLPPKSGNGLETRREIYSGCRDAAAVELYSVVGGGHTWPGGRQYLPQFVIGKTSRDFSANEVIWAFFQAHRLPSKTQP